MENMSVQSREPPKGVTFEEVWALIRENAEQQKETERLIKELTAKIDQEIKETALQMKETDRRLGALGNRPGEVMEHIMSPGLHEKFKGPGFSFSRSSRNIELHDHNEQELAEIDVLLENGEYVLAVEVKTCLTMGDVKNHVRRMEILRGAADGYNDRRKYLGAVAGARSVSYLSRKHAHRFACITAA